MSRLAMIPIAAFVSSTVGATSGLKAPSWGCTATKQVTAGVWGIVMDEGADLSKCIVVPTVTSTAAGGPVKGVTFNVQTGSGGGSFILKAWDNDAAAAYDGPISCIVFKLPNLS